MQESDIGPNDAAASGTAAVASAAKSTAAMAGAAAERTKLLTISLPAAYLALGKHCAEHCMFGQEFPDLYAALSKLAAEMAATAEKLSKTPEATTLAGRAQDLAGKGFQLALAKKQSLQQQKLLHELGKKVYETKGISSGPPELTSSIAQIRDRIAALGASLGNSAQALKQRATAAGRSASLSIDGARKRRWWRSPWVIGAGVGLFVLGLIGASTDKPNGAGQGDGEVEVENGSKAQRWQEQTDQNQAISSRQLTKKEFVKKLEELMDDGFVAATARRMDYYNSKFQKTIGDPDSDQAFGTKRLYTYRCRDGVVQLEVFLGNGGFFQITEINTY